MKKNSANLILVASLLMAGTAMAQTDTLKTPLPDTTKVPKDSIPTDTSSVARLSSQAIELGISNSFLHEGRTALRSSTSWYGLKQEDQTTV